MDQETWEEISKDIRRTRSDLGFFQKPVTYEFDFEQDVVLRRSSKKEERKTVEVNSQVSEETHGDRLARILFIYAKLNPGVKYTQGMNEVLAILYFCFHGHPDSQYIASKYIESDLFCAFSNLMIDLRDGFLREIDD